MERLEGKDLFQVNSKLGKVAEKKIRKKSGLLPNPPRVWFFSVKKIYPHFLLENASIMAETNFTLGPISKPNKFPL